MKAHPGIDEAYSGAVVAHNETVEVHPGAHLTAMEAHLGAYRPPVEPVEIHFKATEAHPVAKGGSPLSHGSSWSL